VLVRRDRRGIYRNYILSGKYSRPRRAWRVGQRPISASRTLYYLCVQRRLLGKPAHFHIMAFVSPPPRPVSTIFDRKRRDSFWRKVPLKSLFVIIKRWSAGGEPQGTVGFGRSGIVETSSFPNSDGGAAPPAAVLTFASLYCKKHRLRSDRFVASVFWKTILPRAHFWGIPIIVVWSREFSADREFIAQAGRVENMEQYLEVEEVFRRWPDCRSFLRGTLGLRVSSRRVRRLVTAAFADAR